MATRSAELNTYRKYSTKIKLISADIWFLKSCKRKSLFPKFIQVKISKQCSGIAQKVEKFAKEKWLDLEIKNLYSTRSCLEVESYSLYKKLTCKLNNNEYNVWSDFQRHMFRMINAKYVSKMSILNRKLKQLMKNIEPNIAPPSVINIVDNQSSQSFDKEEINLLNNGLKFAVAPSGKILDDIIACVESSVQYMPDSSKGFIREQVRNEVSKEMSRNRNQSKNSELKLIKRMKEKDVFYLKADKGNKVVILDKVDYYERVNTLLTNGPYASLLRNPLPKMISDVNNILKKCSNVVTPNLRRSLHVSNPTVPKLYCLPKIHKPGKTMRPIVSAIGAPTYNLAKWLTKKFENLPIVEDNFSVKNSLDFIERIRHTSLQEGEILISFDVSSLFPSVPIPQTLKYLRELLQKNSLSNVEVDELVSLTDLCMRQNCFQVENSFYEQKEGTAMGNPLSPFLANLFMSRFETETSEVLQYFPRIWLRYVDDVFAIFDTTKSNIGDFVSQINQRFPSIKFTFEQENKEQLPFLDVLVIRKDSALEFDIFRKETSTFRYIPKNSHHCHQHKMASLNFLIHRLTTFPLTPVRFETEKNVIKDIAKSNGYSPNVIDKMIRKKLFKLRVNNISTFRNENRETKFLSVPYHRYTKNLGNIFKDQGITVVYKSTHTLQSLLGNPKDKLSDFEKSGIYEINCKDCNEKYVGQTRRSIRTRYKEHFAHIRYGRGEKSSVACHVLEKQHTIDENCLKLVRSVNNNRYLDAYESLEINKCKPSLNSDRGKIPFSPLYNLLKMSSD